MKHYDLVIIGGGMVGASLACALRPLIDQYRWKVAIVEANPLPVRSDEPLQPSYDARSTALSYGTRLIYEQLGLWQQLSERVTPIKHIHVSDRGHFGFIRMSHTEMDVEALGYVIENRWLGSVLHAELAGTDQIEWLCPASVTEIRAAVGGMHMQIALPQADEQDDKVVEISAGLTVLADGGRSSLASQLGLGEHVSDYDQCAVIANITTAKSHQGVAYERFTDQGPMALLPLEQGRSALIWTLPEGLADDVIELDDAGFLALLQERFGYRLGRLQRVGERFSYPLALKWATEQIRPGLVVLGNAAHSLHPVAGQGFNLALRDLMALAQVLAEGAAEDQPLGDLRLLQRYLKQQQQDQSNTVGFSDQVVRLFSNDQPLLAGMRNLGLVSMDMASPIKRWFTEQAMGLGIGNRQQSSALDSSDSPGK